MAKFVTIHLLLNDDNEAAIEGGIAAMVSMADKDWLIDHEVDLARDCPTEIADAIDNETYSPGDAFKPYILYSLEEATRSDGAGFWSNTYGWTTRDLATRFSLTEGPLNKPVTGGEAISINYDKLHAFSAKHRISYNELCAAMRDAINGLADENAALAEKEAL